MVVISAATPGSPDSESEAIDRAVTEHAKQQSEGDTRKIAQAARRGQSGSYEARAREMRRILTGLKDGVQAALGKTKQS